MKNISALWRRLAKKRYEGEVEIRNGRQIRQLTTGYNHPAHPTPFIIGLLKRAGIPTPVFDKMMTPVHTEPEVNALSIDGNDITDVEPISLVNTNMSDYGTVNQPASL